MLEDEKTEIIEQADINMMIENIQPLDELLTQEHLCQDYNAKWLLESLFVAELEPPAFANR